MFMEQRRMNQRLNIDRVRVAKDMWEDHSSVVSCRALWNVMPRFFLPPKLHGHIQQAVIMC